MSVTINGSTGVTTPGISNSEGYTGDGLTIAAGAPSGAVQVDTSGNVGIGTTTPSSKLTIAGGTAGTYADGILLSKSGGNFYGVYTDANDLIVRSVTGSTEVCRFTYSGNLQFNSGYGSAATAYGCRAWVNFNGSGTVAIRASGNVSSITDNGTGNYTINFTTAMPDVNYVVTGNGCITNASNLRTVNPYLYATTYASIGITYADGQMQDVSSVNVAIFR